MFNLTAPFRLQGTQSCPTVNVIWSSSFSERDRSAFQLANPEAQLLTPSGEVIADQLTQSASIRLWKRNSRPSLLFSVLISVVIVLTAAGIALVAGWLSMPVATVLEAIIAILFIGAGFPNRVRQHLDHFDRRQGIVALDHQFAMPAALFISVVLNYNRQA